MVSTTPYDLTWVTHQSTPLLLKKKKKGVLNFDKFLPTSYLRHIKNYFIGKFQRL